MNWLSLSLLVVLGMANVVIAGLVFARDAKKFNNVMFALLTLSIAVWVVGIVGFFLSHSREVALTWAQIYYIAPLLIGASGMFFALSFPDGKKIRPLVLLLILGCFLALFLPMLFNRDILEKGLVYHTWGKEVVLRRSIYSVYCLYITVFFLIILFVMRKKSQNLRGIYALQARLFFIGLSVAAVFGVLFNLVLPFLGNYRLIGLGPLFTSVSASVIGYAIVKHRMFDIGLLVARSLAYMLSLLAISVVYGFIVFGVARLVFDVHLSAGTQVVLVSAMAVAALSFSGFKTRFDRLTNRLFYRDAYDPQDLFDNLNRLLVSTLNLDKLSQGTTNILADRLKAQFCLIGLREVIGKPQRIIGTAKLDMPFEDIMAVRRLTVKYHHSMIVTDNLERQGYAELKELLTKNEVAVLVRLAPNVSKTEEGLGYLVLGPKKSGNPYTTQDLRVLDTVAKELIIAIQNALHYEEIQNFNLTLQQKVVEATNKLRRANERLKQLDETKDDFISMASHQLRTPLTSVKGYLSMVLEGDAGKVGKTQRDMLGQAFISSQRMVYLIADLLNVSRLRTGKFVIEPSPVDLSEVVEQEMSQLVETAAGKHLTLTYDKPQGFPQLMLDETKTRQVIMNYMDNAIYYTPAGGNIRIELENKPATVELRVVDDGIGVPASEQHHLFTKFYRAGNARKMRPDGTGLGLYMAKKVIMAEGGSIIFESKEGKGSTFGFTFSKSKLAVDTPVR